jgi:1-acyl-sn-glycerol-3-phosphate acyltransferase
MKKILVIATYFILYWIILPVGLIAGSSWIDKLFFRGNSLPEHFRPIGWVIIGLGFILMVFSVYQFKKISGAYPVSALPPKELIEKGVFAVWRHPVYLFAVIIFMGCAFAVRSIGFLVVTLPVFLILLGGYIWIEEFFLIKRFGSKYIAYRKRVPLLLPRFINILRVIAWPLFRLRFNMKIIQPENIPDSPPYFVVSAHRNYLDPFFISYSLPHMVRHLCTYEMFRGAVRSMLFKWMGAIPKRRYKTDHESNRQLIKALNNRYAIGLFPEGGRSWTGEMRSLKPETLMLLRHFSNIPILPVRMEGNYHSWPRWSDLLLKADLRINIGAPFYLDNKMEITEIDTLITEKINPDHRAEHTIICKTKDRIGKLSIVIYRCPHCSQPDAMQELPPDTLMCKWCKKRYILHPDFSLSAADGFIPESGSIGSIYREIRIRQTDLKSFPEKLRNSLYSSSLSPGEQLIYHAEGQYWVETGSSFRLKQIGEVLLTNQRIIISPDEEQFILNLNEIDAVTIESNYKLQIYQKNSDLLIQLTFPSSSPLLWQDLLVLILEKSFGKKVITR